MRRLKFMQILGRRSFKNGSLDNLKYSDEYGLQKAVGQALNL
jgi:hypothetical protein